MFDIHFADSTAPYAASPGGSMVDEHGDVAHPQAGESLLGRSIPGPSRGPSTYPARPIQQSATANDETNLSVCFGVGELVQDLYLDPEDEAVMPINEAGENLGKRKLSAGMAFFLRFGRKWSRRASCLAFIRRDSRYDSDEETVPSDMVAHLVAHQSLLPVEEGLDGVSSLDAGDENVPFEEADGDDEERVTSLCRFSLPPIVTSSSVPSRSISNRTVESDRCHIDRAGFGRQDEAEHTEYGRKAVSQLPAGTATNDIDVKDKGSGGEESATDVLEHVPFDVPDTKIPILSSDAMSEIDQTIFAHQGYSLPHPDFDNYQTETSLEQRESHNYLLSTLRARKREFSEAARDAWFTSEFYPGNHTTPDVQWRVAAEYRKLRSEENALQQSTMDCEGASEQSRRDREVSSDSGCLGVDVIM